MANYPPIADHGLIGDLQTAALVSTDGTIDWFCCPRFDSPSAFASLLDHEKGGHFALHAVDDCVTKQMYLPDTAVLATRFLSPKGVAEVIDFMPIEKPGIATDHHRVGRAVRGVRGELSSRRTSSRGSTTGANHTRSRSMGRTRSSRLRR
jgi:GH15 family glucan-1,4-alpha-glucosidase